MLNLEKLGDKILTNINYYLENDIDLKYSFTVYNNKVSIVKLLYKYLNVYGIVLINNDYYLLPFRNGKLILINNYSYLIHNIENKRYNLLL